MSGSNLKAGSGDSRVDVAVIGGGPAGSATAMALSKSGLRVAIVERQAAPKLRVGETLAPDVRPVLQTLGVWKEFLAAGHIRSVGNRSLWGSDRPSDYSFIFSPYGCGWHLDRQRFDEMLLRAAVSAGATSLAGFSLSKAVPLSHEGWTLELSKGREQISLRAHFVVDATGRASVFARHLGAKRQSLDTLVGIVGYLDRGDEQETVAYVTLVEAAEKGWWYSAHLPEGKLVVAYMTDANIAARQEAIDPAKWTELLKATEYTRERAESGGYHLSSVPKIISANSSYLNVAAGSRWMAVGDAAATYDPLSSQGIATALSSGLNAARSIMACFEGDADALRDYAVRIKQEFAKYLNTRRSYYAIEKRWPDSSFWQTRSRGGARSRPIQSPSAHS